MKVDYNILWIDDKIANRPFQSIAATIKKHLDEQFFNCEITQAEDFNEFKEAYSLNNEYDIIITDYSLNEGTTGQQVIDFVRENQHDFTEIFFYSANKDLNNIELFSRNRISFFQLSEGNYKELQNEIKIVLDQTIKKFQHIVVMRGMIMNETSSLDIQMLEIISNSLNSDKIDFESLAVKIYDRLNSLFNEKNKFVDECRASKKFKRLTKDPVVFSADYKIQTLQQILFSLEQEDYSTDYKNEIISLRNKFAHAVLIKDDKGRQYFQHGSTGITFDDNLCKTIRKNINKYRNNFTNTLRKIQEQQ